MARLDWSAASVGIEPEPCVICGRGAYMRSPDKGVPCHKTCAERWLADREAAKDSFKTVTTELEENP
jgi:hypothetical protein